jgi:hypothetical protein
VRGILIFLFFCSLPISICLGQEKLFVPVLNEHRFVFNRISRDPFVKSSFRINTGIGESQKVNLPTIEIGDTVIVPTAGKLTYANINAELNVQLNKSVAYFFGFGASAKVGTEPSSLYTNGLNSITGIHNAWKIRLFSNDKHYLSTQLGISTYNASIINVAQFIRDVINSNPDADISQNINVLQGFGSIHYATAFGSMLGMNVVGRYIYGDSFQSSKLVSEFFTSFGLDFNLYPKTKVPIGVSAAYAYTSMPEYTASQNSITSIGNIKIAYTGSDSFIISLDVSSFNAPYLLGRIVEKNQIETRIFNVALNILIYFN